MERQEYLFKIDAYSPETLPMRRFAEYVQELAKLFGHAAEVHFQRIDKGSAVLVSSVDPPAQERLRIRLHDVGEGTASKEAMKAFRELDNKLAADNAVGTLMTNDQKNVLKFPGRSRPKAPEYPVFTEATTLQGQLVSLSGKDDTKHAVLLDGEATVSGIETRNLELLSRLKQHLWGQPVRLIGRGRFQRLGDGSWEMKGFIIDDFEPLEDISFSDAVARLRSLPDGIKVDQEMLDDWSAERRGDDN